MNVSTQEMKNAKTLAARAIAVCIVLWIAACARRSATSEKDWGPDVAPLANATEAFEVPPPPFSAGIFPCSDCHDPSLPVNTTRRPMVVAHSEIKFTHDSEHRWCLDCHDAKDRDSLHLASGEKVPFEESYRLCGQCHGDKYRDWKVGVHGRRSGDWNGHKTYLLCVICHNAHAPHFAPIKPEPPPHRPERTP